MSPISPQNAWQPRRPTRQWRMFLLATILMVVVVFLLERAGAITVGRGLANLGHLGWLGWLSFGDQRALARLRVAVVEPAYHAEVLVALLSVLDDIGVNATAYAVEQDVIRAAADLRPSSPQPISATSMAGSVTNGDFDVVVLNSCDAEFWDTPDNGALWRGIQTWATSAPAPDPVDKPAVAARRRIICLPHDIQSYRGRKHDDDPIIGAVAEKGELDFVTLADQTKTALQHIVGEWSEQSERAAWERIAMGIESFVPIVPLPADLEPRVTRDRIHKAGIVGRIGDDSQSYNNTLHDLANAILANASHWGYSVTTTPIVNTTDMRTVLTPMGKPDEHNPNPQRVPDYSNTSEAFTLHLIGFAEQPVIPAILNDKEWPVVRVENPTERGLYATVRDMDVILPTFSDLSFIEAQASVSIPTALVAETPLLVSHRLLQAYPYLSYYPPAYIVAPRAVGVMGALLALRRGEDPSEDEFGDLAPPSPLSAPLDSYSEYTQFLRKENARVWARLLLRSSSVG